MRTFEVEIVRFGLDWLPTADWEFSRMVVEIVAD